MSCLKDTITKKYIIPTDKWLQPLKPLVVNDINTDGFIMIGKLIEKEKVIIKISQGYKPLIIKINKLIKYMPNFVKTYCSFNCYEDFNYTDKNGFCNGNEKSGDIITLEIMKKYYEGSLKKYIGRFNLETVIDIIIQLLLAQLHAFFNVQFVHNDISLDNILLSSKESILEYKFLNKRKGYKSKLTIYISDFGESKILDAEYFQNKDQLDKDLLPLQTLTHNLYNTTLVCLDLLDNIEIKNNIRYSIITDETMKDRLTSAKRQIRNIYRDNYDIDCFIYYKSLTSNNKAELIRRLY